MYLQIPMFSVMMKKSVLRLSGENACAGALKCSFIFHKEDNLYD